MLDVINVTKRYGKVQALDGFTLHVSAGEIVGLVGHNGAGKTTFIEIVSGLTRADSGTVRVDGLDPTRARARIGFSPQQDLYPPTTVREHLKLFGGLAGLRRKRLQAEIEELAETMRLTSFLTARPVCFSGGQQRRTQAAVRAGQPATRAAARQADRRR